MQLPAAAGVPICLCLARSPCPGLALRQHGAPPARLPPLPGRSTVREERGAEAQPGPGAGPARRTRSGRTPAVQAAGARGAPCSPGQLGWGRRPRAIRWKAAQGLGATCRVPVQQPRCHPRHMLGVGPAPGTWDRRPCEGTPGHGVPPDTVTQQGRKTVGRLAESHGGMWRGPGAGCAGALERGARGPWSGSRPRRGAGSGLLPVGREAPQLPSRGPGGAGPFPKGSGVPCGGCSQREACHCHRLPTSPRHQPPGLPAPLPPAARRLGVPSPGPRPGGTCSKCPPSSLETLPGGGSRLPRPPGALG